MLYGRSAECGLIDNVFDGARRGRAGALVLRGEAGIGKSALLQYAAEQAGDARVLDIRGVQAESGLPFAGLHALLYPVRYHMSSLSLPQRRALNAALGLELAEAPSRFLVAAAVVELLAMLAEECPLVCLVDDAQWVDPQSLGTLTFAQRRLRADRAAMLFALRIELTGNTGYAHRLLADLPQLALGPLDGAAADQLINERKGLSPSARAAVRVAARGNPLALVALAVDGQSEIPGQPPPLTEHLEASYLRRAMGMSHRVRDLLLLAAVGDAGDLAILMQAARRHRVTEQDLAAAEARGLLTVAAGKVEFTHPLVRSAVYHNATSTRRREAHLALAAALNDINPARAIWHRAAAAVAPAEEVATELLGLGATAARQGDTDLAARAYARAAELTADSSGRVSLLLDAAEASWECGRPEQAAELVASARETAQSRDHLASIDHLRGLLEASTGSALHGCDILLAGAERILDVAPIRAAAMVFDAMRVASVAGDMQRVAHAGQTAGRLIPSESHPASAFFAAGIAALLTGSGAGAVAELEEGLRAIRVTDDAEQLCMAATAAAFTGDFTRTHLLASQAVSRCRETGALGHLAWALEVLVVTQLETAPRQAEASADEGLRAARETNQVASEAIHLATLATVAAMRGDRPTTEKLAGQVFELDRAHGLAFPAARATAALGLLELGLGRPAEALVHCEALATTHGHRAIQLAAADVAMLAAVWSGEDEKAHELMATVGSWRWVREADAEWAEATLNRWQALVAPDAEAGTFYERSLTHQTRSPRSFPQALTHLLYGEHLRRIRQRSAARPQLRMAIEIFERLDAVPWAARARTQLRATGETVRRYQDRPGAPDAAGTPGGPTGGDRREHQVSRCAAVRESPYRRFPSAAGVHQTRNCLACRIAGCGPDRLKQCRMAVT